MPRLRLLGSLLLAALLALTLTGCATVYDPDAVTPVRWVRDPSYSAAVVEAVGADEAAAAWRFAVDFALTHQFQEDLMDPAHPPTADQLARTVLDDLSETAKPYWTEQAALAVQGDSTARGNLNVLQFSGWSPRAQVTKPGRDTMLRTQAIERGAVDYDATTEEITVRFSYRAIVQMSAQGRPVRLHAKNRPTYWLARQPAGGHLIDSYQGSLVIDEV